MSNEFANLIRDVDHHAPDWKPYSTLPIDYPSKNVYPQPGPTNILGFNQQPSSQQTNHYYPYAQRKTPSTTPSLASSLSSPSSASSGEDEDIPVPLPARTPLRYPNSLIQKISLVDKLVETASSVIDAIWGPSLESQQIKVVPTAQFVREILKRSKTTYSTLQAALYYIFRIKATVTDRIIRRNASPMEQPSAQDCIFCGRRMFLAAIMAASKFLQDKTYRNSAWAKISGLTTCEITYSEMAFLQLIDFKLFISKDTFDRWHCLLSSHVHQLMKTLPKTRCLPIGLLPPAYEPCAAGYDHHQLDHFGQSKVPDFSYNTLSLSNLGLTSSSYGLNSKRNGLNEPSQPRKKPCQMK